MAKVRLPSARLENSNLVAIILSVVGFFVLGCGLATINHSDAFPGLWALMPVVSAIFLIAAGQRALLNRVFLSHRVMVWFGLISFPLYLWHWPLLSFARIIEGDVPSVQIRLILVVMSVLLAWLTYILD
ncbi:MAG: acyltransferase [Gammaproteobacteria bacterium]|nr:acyltransferase [Gammaproteobacteria bacterium]